MMLVDDFVSGGGSFQLRLANKARHIQTVYGWKPLWMGFLMDAYHIINQEGLNPDDPFDNSVRLDAVKVVQESWVIQNAKGQVYIDERSYVVFFELEEDATLWKLTYQ